MALRFSKSSIGDYNNCPRKYYLKKFTLMGRQPMQNEPDYLTNGKRVHTYAENYNRGIEDPVDNENEFVITNVANFHCILNSFGLDRAKYAEMKHYDEVLDLVGVVDAIYEVIVANPKTEEFVTEYWLIDYKTGKYRESKKTEMRFELYLYVYLAEKFMDIKIDKIGMFYTQFPECSFVEKMARKKIDSNVLKFQNAVQKIRSLDFHRIEGPLCKHCEFIYCCESYKDEIID